ncbi:MAG: hypothetical protein QM677_10975 [Microbacterium sp.]
MAESGIRKADAAAFAALVIVATITSLGIALWTDIDGAVRWVVTIAAGILAAALTYSVVSRRSRRSSEDQ